jgi:type II secretory pathway pseudopilin PulG
MFAWSRKMLNRKEHGFMLIDLVVVLAILGILVAVAAPRYRVAKKTYKAKAVNLVQESKVLVSLLS